MREAGGTSDHRAHEVGAPLGEQELEHERAREVVEVGPQVGGRQVHLADQEGIARRRARGPRARAAGPAPSCASGGARARPSRASRGTPCGSRAGGTSQQVGMLADAIDRVDAEAVDAAGEPGAHDLVHRGGDGRVAPVEVGLLGVERVQVAPPGVRVARRRGAAERRPPVVRRVRPSTRSGRDAPGTRGARSRCGSARGRAAAAFPARAPPPPARATSATLPRRGSTPVWSAMS